jgi:crotonobetainyl-CoA:carnitine CoA-transferase CaiB-like acyl-CoA transferase
MLATTTALSAHLDHYRFIIDELGRLGTRATANLLEPWVARGNQPNGSGTLSGKRLGSAHQATAPYQAIRAADGWVTLGAVTPTTWTGLCSALGLAELVDDPRYQDAHERHRHRETLIPAIEAVTTLWTTDAVIAALESGGVPCAPIADTEQVFNDSVRLWDRIGRAAWGRRTARR